MRRILVVVDMLNDFVHSDGTLNFEEARKIVPNVAALVDEYRENGQEVVYACDNHLENDLEFERFESHAVRGTWGGMIIEELEMHLERHGYMLYKSRYSAFYDTKLDHILDMLKPDLVEVCGVCTSICVMDTVGGLANRDYKVRVVKDAVADFDPEMHEMALKRMALLYGAEVWDSKERKEFV